MVHRSPADEGHLGRSVPGRPSSRPHTANQSAPWFSFAMKLWKEYLGMLHFLFTRKTHH